MASDDPKPGRQRGEHASAHPEPPRDAAREPKKGLCENCADRETPIIMVTSLSSKSDVLGCMRLGIQGYIVKPFSPVDIPKQIMDCLRTDRPEWVQAAQQALP